MEQPVNVCENVCLTTHLLECLSSTEYTTVLGIIVEFVSLISKFGKKISIYW